MGFDTQTGDTVPADSSCSLLLVYKLVSQDLYNSLDAF